MNNSFYGKTIENIRKRLNLDLIDKSDAHRLLNRHSKLSFDDEIAEYENLFCIHLIKKLSNLQNLFMLDFVYWNYQNF